MSQTLPNKPPKPTAPYPGLRPFRQDEAKLFFGRDAQIDDVLARLKQHQFLGVVGTSGCGKSSLIRAGMLPALESGLMGELGSSWFIADMKPGDAPLTNLAKALMQSGVLGDRWSNTPEGIALLTAALRRSDVSLVNLIQQVGLPKYTNLLVLADQFEEIFRFQQSDPNEALAFVNLLLATGHDRSTPIYVVLTMRSDFLGPCALFPGLPEALNDAQYLCPRLTRDQLAEAIEGPASVFGGEVERALVTQIVNDAGANSDQLPLVQHVLARMWHRISGEQHQHIKRAMRLDDYRKVGGLKGVAAQRETSSGTLSLTGRGVIEFPIFQQLRELSASRGFTPNALSQHADEAYFDLQDDSSASADHGPDHKPSRKQWTAQMLFRSLAERGPSGQYVRRPVKVQDVAAVVGCSIPEVIAVVEVFRREDRSFLVPPVGVALDAQSMLDISHEALIRQWQRFGGQSEQSDGADSSQPWLAIEDQSRRRYSRLVEAAECESKFGLLKNPELDFLNQWWQKFQPGRFWGNARVSNSFDRTQTFLQKSMAQAEEESHQRDADRRERVRQAEATATRMRRFALAIGMVAIVALILLVKAVSATREAARQETAALKARDEAKKSAIKADQQTKFAERATQDVLVESQKNEATLARSNYLLARARWNEDRSGEAQGLLRSVPVAYRHFEWHYSRRQFDTSDTTLRGHTGAVSSVSVSRDGSRIVSGSWDNTLKMWDAASGRETRTLTGHAGEVRTVSFSPDGQRIVSGSEDKTLKVWDAAGGQELLTLKGHAGIVTSVSFSRDGNRIVSGSVDSTLKVWDPANGQEMLTLKGHASDVTTVSFSPDGQRIVSGSVDNTLKVWDAASGQELLTLKGHAHRVTSVSFSPDGKWIVSGSWDKTLKVWDAAGDQEPLTLTGHTNGVTSVSFNADGKRVVSGSFDETLKVWDAAGGQGLLTLNGLADGVASVSFSPDRKRIVSGSEDKTLKVRDTAGDQEPLTLTGHTDRVASVSFSLDGKRIVSGSDDNTLKVWDVENGQELLTLTGHTNGVTSVCFSPDGRRIVSGSWDNTLKVWDAAGGQEPLTLKGHAHPVTSVCFSPVEKRIVSGSEDKTLKVWDAAGGQEPLTLTGHTGIVTSVSFSPDGKRIVSGSVDTTLKVWDAASGQELLTLKGHADRVRSVSFSPDGTRIVSGSGDITLKVWDAANGQELLTLRGHRDSVLNVGFSPDGTRIVSGSGDGTIKIWNGTPKPWSEPGGWK